jgi:phosphoribosyl-ATP pyrophosphohydrolase
LIQVKPVGPTCHTGLDTCWQESNNQEYGFISTLEKIIKNRRENADSEKSYVASLFEKGINKIAQKVGEEAVEVVIEAKDSNDHLFLDESADLLFHYLIKTVYLDVKPNLEISGLPLWLYRFVLKFCYCLLFSFQDFIFFIARTDGVQNLQVISSFYKGL